MGPAVVPVVAAASLGAPTVVVAVVSAPVVCCWVESAPCFFIYELSTTPTSTSRRTHVLEPSRGTWIGRTLVLCGLAKPRRKLSAATARIIAGHQLSRRRLLCRAAVDTLCQAHIGSAGCWRDATHTTSQPIFTSEISGR